jgi:hypothetical protein
MSYTLKTKCARCKKNIQCIDSTFVQAAISGIHSVNYDNGSRKELHLGSGSIEIQCNNFVDKMPEENPNK